MSSPISRSPEEEPLNMTTPPDIPAILLVLATLFGTVNYWFIKLPHTIGLMIIALIASLSVVALWIWSFHPWESV